jgi:hypothetical protein
MKCSPCRLLAIAFLGLFAAVIMIVSMGGLIAGIVLSQSIPAPPPGILGRLDITLHFLFATIFTAGPLMFICVASLIIKYLITGPEKPNDEKGKKHKFLQKFALAFGACFVISGVLMFIFSHIMEAGARKEVRRFLEGLCPDPQVAIDGHFPRDSNLIIADLKEFAPSIPRHTHWTGKRIVIKISTENGSLVIELGRDSGNPQIYWVFYPLYRYTTNNSIGEISTNLFDDY